MSANRLYIATESFHTHDEGGAPVTVNVGSTLLWEDHDLVRRFPQFFKESPDHVRPDVESASAAPGEKREVKIGGATGRTQK